MRISRFLFIKRGLVGLMDSSVVPQECLWQNGYARTGDHCVIRWAIMDSNHRLPACKAGALDQLS